MAVNNIYIPELNPVIFFSTDRTNLPAYFTKHFEDFTFGERQYYWQQQEDYKQIWQTTDIINLQFESTFSPIDVNLLDEDGKLVISLPAIMGLPNKFIPGTFSFEVSMSLGSLATGCYRLQLILGSGITQKIMLSTWQYISSTPLENTLLLQYWNSRFHRDVLFETGIKFQLRVTGVFGFLDKVRKDEQYHDENYNPTLLNTRTAKQWPVYFGTSGEGILSRSDFYGLPDDIINIIDEIWSCDNVMIDGKFFGIAEGTKLEYTTADSAGMYPKRGVKVTVEAGINRNSRIVSLDVDPAKKLITTIIVDAKVFGDTANQGSTNTVPVYNVE